MLEQKCSALSTYFPQKVCHKPKKCWETRSFCPVEVTFNWVAYFFKVIKFEVFSCSSKVSVVVLTQSNQVFWRATILFGCTLSTSAFTFQNSLSTGVKQHFAAYFKSSYFSVYYEVQPVLLYRRVTHIG